MAGIGPLYLLSKIGVASALLFLTAGLAAGQDLARPGASNSTAAEDASDVHALAQSVRELQAQVQALNSEVSALRTEARELRGQSGHAKAPVDTSPKTSGDYDAYSLAASEPPISGSPVSSAAMASPPQNQSIEDRLTQIEENQTLAAANVQEQSQTKVESGSKYRVRLSGIVLVNMFGMRGNVDNMDIPEIATPQGFLDTAGSFAGSLRQSQIGLEAFGPDILGAHTSANIRFDFAGGFPNVPNGVSEGLVRLRTGTIRFDWTNTSVIAGQDYLFFAPLAPTSMASLAVPALSYAGNLWSWTPQIRLEHRITLSDRSSISLEGGILDSFSGDLPGAAQSDRYPSWGEMSGLPAFAGRLAWKHTLFGKSMTIGTGGYFGRQFWGFGRYVNGWASTTDLTLPLGKSIEFSGMFFRGSALGGLGGAIGQDVLFSGSIVDRASVFKGLDSIGGWAQLKFKLWPTFEVNGAFGEDNPFASELRMYPASASYYGSLFSRNLSPFANFVYRPRSDVVLSLEYRYLRTSVFGGTSSTANIVNASVGYLF